MPSVQLNSTCFLLEKREKKVGGQRHYQMPSKQSCERVPKWKIGSRFSKALPTKRAQWGLPLHAQSALQQKLKPQLDFFFFMKTSNKCGSARATSGKKESRKSLDFMQQWYYQSYHLQLKSSETTGDRKEIVCLRPPKKSFMTAFQSLFSSLSSV